MVQCEIANCKEKATHHIKSTYFEEGINLCEKHWVKWQSRIYGDTAQK